jgi:hypothetical protein
MLIRINKIIHLNYLLLCGSCGRLKKIAKQCLLSSPVQPRLRLGQKTQTRTKKMHFLGVDTQVTIFT